MNRLLQHLFHIFTGLAALLSAVATHAATNADAAPPPSRAALREACKDADSELQQAMGALVAQRGLEGAVRIDMEIQGKRVSAVSVAGGSPADRPDIRRAVRRLNCDTGAAELRTVSFEVTFARDETARSAGG